MDSEIQKWVWHFFAKHINPRSLGSLCMKGTKESVPRVDSLVALMHHDLSDLGLICLEKETKNLFLDFRIQAWNFLKIPNDLSSEMIFLT